MKDEEIKIDKYICRAKISTPTEADADWDFEAVAVPFENGQIRYSYENDEYFNQVLGVERENIDSKRLEIGLPLFDNHPYDTSACNILGITTTYDFDERGLVVRVKLGARADEALKSDIKNGIIRSVSIEGKIDKYEITRSQNEYPVYKAIRWTPESLSLAPVPNDVGAKIEVARSKFIEKNEQELIESAKQETKYSKLIQKF